MNIKGLLFILLLQVGYAIGYGFNKAEAFGEAIRNAPKGATKYPAEYIKISPNKYKCIIKWRR
tara:strand:- start:153 stop:341 length:189 start_codon:yes stop_codon:yes gene_type:complete